MRQSRQVMFILLILITTSVAMSQVFRGSKIITGYELGSFAVKGKIESQVMELIKEIRGKMQEGYQLEIVVIGSADKTGSSPRNDQIAKDRAEQIAAVLKANFPEPEAKITAWSKGDAENSRQVKVEYKIIPTSVGIRSTKELLKKTGFPFFWLLGAILLGLFIIGLIISLKTPGTRTKIEAPEQASGFQWVEIRVDNENFLVQVEYKDGKFYLPFKTAQGFQIIRSDRRGVVDSLKGCLKKQEFSSQKEELIRKDIIKRIK